MSTRQNISGGSVTFTRIAAKSDATSGSEHRAKAAATGHPAKPAHERNVNSGQFTDLAIIGFQERTAKADAPRDSSLEQQANDFAQKRRLSADARALFVTVAKHFEKTGKAIQADGFELARLSDIPYEAVKSARQELAGWGIIVTRSDNSMGVDGLYPGPEWRNRGGRW